MTIWYNNQSSETLLSHILCHRQSFGWQLQMQQHHSGKWGEDEWMLIEGMLLRSIILAQYSTINRWFHVQNHEWLERHSFAPTTKRLVHQLLTLSSPYWTHPLTLISNQCFWPYLFYPPPSLFHFMFLLRLATFSYPFHYSLINTKRQSTGALTLGTWCCHCILALLW